ncbi:unnamed protein product, partial [Ascophyllum nodosum]
RFNTIGSERKAGTKTGEKIKNDKIRQWKRTKEEAFSAKIRKSLRIKVKWDFTEEDLARAKAILAKAASTY